MFYATIPNIKRKVKSFVIYFTSAAVMTATLTLIVMMGLSDNIWKDICADISALGLALLSARICYVYLVNRNKKQNRRNRKHTRARTRKSCAVVDSAPVLVPAPVVKPVFFDYEAHP